MDTWKVLGSTLENELGPHGDGRFLGVFWVHRVEPTGLNRELVSCDHLKG
jgi:hypothetical protein